MEMPNEGTVGWRFSPKDEELVNYFLRRKINGKEDDVRVIREIDVCKWEPWDLPDQSVLKSDDKEWFFFCPRDQKYPSSSRLNRATRKGYWKTTGKDRKIRSKKNEIGIKKTLVFHTGRAPMGKRTYWVMHEYRATLKELDGTHPGQKPYVICRLFKKDDESVLDATDNNAELASLSPVPYGECSPVDLKPELVPHQVVPLAEQEGEKYLISSENFNDENCKTPSQDALCDRGLQIQMYENSPEDKMQPQPDENFDYHDLFSDPDPINISLYESPMMESLGSSLPPHSATDNFHVNENFLLESISDEHDDYTSGVLLSFLTDNSRENQANNWLSTADYGIPEYAHMSQYEFPDMKSNSEETQLSQLVAELEQYASNAESNGSSLVSPSQAMDNTWASFQEIGNLQNRPEYQGTTFSNGPGIEDYAFSENKISCSHDNLSKPDLTSNSGIQIRRRQPQVRPDISNFNKHGTAQRRIHLQTNLRPRLSSPYESAQQDTSEIEDGSEVNTPIVSLRVDSGPAKSVEVSSNILKSKDAKRNVTKKFISSFFIGLASIATIVVAYAGFHGCLGRLLSSRIN